MKQNVTAGKVIGTVLVTLFAALCVLPLLYMAAVSFTDSQSLNIKISDLRPDLSNYVYAITKRNFGLALKNSVITVVGSCLLVDVVSTMAAYGFEKKPVPGKEALFQGYIATMMIPGQVILIPMFMMMNRAHLSNTYAALILPMVGAFGIFLMRQFMVAVPNELLEAAEIDGCGEVRRFLTIAVPLVQPALITLTVFTFNAAWNNFLWPLIINTRSEMAVLPVTMSTLSSNSTTNYGMVMAGATLTFLFPFVLYIFLQKQFVEGIALGGVKG
ncbi:MAG: carbohydrate ABC transporter permease [Clostridia bacterium]|nr:carbohydrate ABC transporter permease [Clostridia bacterium]